MSALALAAISLGCRLPAERAQRNNASSPLTQSDTERISAPTFNQHVAPILWRQCVSCHRPGGIAPFALTDEAAVARRARDIVAVTQSGYMPPWKPVGARGRFVGERGLSDEELVLLERWLATGLSGGPGAPPPLPEFSEGWQLGEPDAIVQLAPGFALPASGEDQVRNFVLPIPHLTGRLVAALEFDPGVRAVVHHANVLADTTGSARELDRRSEEPGYTGMVGAVAPGGHFFGWTPGKSARRLEADAAWQIDPDTDLVVQLHLQPSGKPELVRPRVGLHFTSRPPQRRPVILHLGSTAIDLPPRTGVQTFSDQWVLPHDVEIVSVYPHAHDLGRTVRVWATAGPSTSESPRPSTTELLRIEDWDFDWQDEYTFAHPIELPAGTTLHLEVGFENSAENVRNPFSPPQRVRWGPQTTDEMADVWLKAYASRDGEQPALRRAAARKDLEIALDGLRQRLELEPGNPEWPARLGLALLNLGRGEEAAPLLRRALARFPSDAGLHYNLGLAHAASRRPREAQQAFERALELDPQHAASLSNLAALDLASGDHEAARRLLGPWLDQQASDAPPPLEMLLNLALAELRAGALDRAGDLLDTARERAPGDDRIHNHLGTLAVRRGDAASAERSFSRAHELAPARTEALKNLASLAAARGDFPGAERWLLAALERDRNDASIHGLLARARGESGEVLAAVKVLRTAATELPEEPSIWFDLSVWLEAAEQREEALAAAQRARQLAPGDSDVVEQESALLASLGRLEEALRTITQLATTQRSVRLRLLETQLLAASGRTAEALDVITRLEASPQLLESEPQVQAALAQLKRELADLRR